jgi:hypothetical protein
MDFLHQRFEPVQSAEFRVDIQIIAHRVITAETAEPVLQADGMNGHEPENAGAHVPQPVQMRLESGESAFFGVLPHIDLVDAEVVGPIAMIWPKAEIRRSDTAQPAGRSYGIRRKMHHASPF